MVVAPCIPDAAVAQARTASQIGGCTKQVAAKAARVTSPSTCWIRRWFEKSHHRSIRDRSSSSVSKFSDKSSSSHSRSMKFYTIPFCHRDPWAR